MAAGSSNSATRRSALQMASGVLAPAGLWLASSPARQAGSCYTSPMMRCMMSTASTGYWPDADSADSITASAPS